MFTITEQLTGYRVTAKIDYFRWAPEDDLEISFACGDVEHVAHERCKCSARQ